MKIVHILYSGLGGHGNVFFSFIKADENKKFEYEAIFAGVEKIREEYVAKCTDNNIKWKYVAKRVGLDPTFNKSIISAIKESDSSIIFLHGSRFILLAKMGALLSKHKKRIVVRETQPNHLKTKAEWISLFLAMFLADRIVFLTDTFKEEIRKKLKWAYRPQKTTTINNGLDLAFFTPIVKPVTNTIVIGMQSRIMNTKDHDTLLRAFAILQAQHPEFSLQLKIAGDGDLLNQMKLLATELKIEAKVLFTGMLNEPDLVNFMRSLDIYVHASLGETMSTAIMQAMACKLPIIASDVPGINNMIDNNKTGLLVQVKNEDALVEAFYFIITEPAKAAAMKQAAFDFALLNYSNKIMFTKYLNVFEKIYA